MAPRVDSELLLVGSLPAGWAEEALRHAAAFCRGLVFALPDGETGPRSAWVGYERERLVRPNPGVVVTEETASPTGIPRHAYETPVFGLKPGVTELHWDSWPRIDDAIAGPRYLRSEDRSFFRPLADLEPGDARVFLGIVLPIDGEAGLRRRQDTASRYLENFGVAMYCGFGRQPGADGTETMREHARVVRAVRGAADRGAP